MLNEVILGLKNFNTACDTMGCNGTKCHGGLVSVPPSDEVLSLDEWGSIGGESINVSMVQNQASLSKFLCRERSITEITVITEMHSHGLLLVLRKEIRMGRKKGPPRRLMDLHCNLRFHLEFLLSLRFLIDFPCLCCNQS